MYYSWKDIQHAQDLAYSAGHDEGYRLGKQDSDMMVALDKVDIEQVQRERDWWRQLRKESLENEVEADHKRINAEDRAESAEIDRTFWKSAALTLLVVNVGIALVVAWGCS